MDATHFPLSEVSLGDLPLAECYFAGEDHPGFNHPGGLVILHVPTGDVWTLSPFGNGDRSLCLCRIINGWLVPDCWAPQVEALRHAAVERMGGLAPIHPQSEIVQTDQSAAWAEPDWMRHLSTLAN